MTRANHGENGDRPDVLTRKEIAKSGQETALQSDRRVVDTKAVAGHDDHTPPGIAHRLGQGRVA